MLKRLRLLVILLILGLMACTAPAVAPTPTRTPPAAGIPTDPALSATPDTRAAPGTTPASTAAPGEPTATPIGPYGPTNFPADVNPLTGLPVSDPAVLNRRPLLVKISNESEAVRPQSGWSFADHVWEHQMEGYAQTRYTAVFLSQSPQQAGSLRSGRMPDVEHFVDMYGGIFVLSGGSTNLNHNPPGPPRIRELILAAPWRNRVVSEQIAPFMSAPYLVRIPNVPRAGVAGYHTLFAIPSEIWRWATEQGLDQRPNLTGLAFDTNVPSGGAPTSEMVIDYPGSGPKHTWRYDTTSERWLSSTNDKPDEDYLVPGVQIGFDNVVIIHVPHYNTDFLEQEGSLGELYGVGIRLTGEGDAVLLRDGQRYNVRWRRVGTEGMLQFVDASGAVVYFKPGTTFFHTADTTYFPPAITFAS